MQSMNLKRECEQESDGRWLAEVPQLPGVLAYGANAEDAMAKAEALALRVLASAWRTVKRVHWRSIFRSRLHEPLAFHEGQACLCCIAEHRLGVQAEQWLPSHPVNQRLRLILPAKEPRHRSAASAVVRPTADKSWRSRPASPN